MKPILFNTEMVRATLAGMKTATRRVVKPQFCTFADGKTEEFVRIESDKSFRFLGVAKDHENIKTVLVPPCTEGEILYVREAWGDYRECSQDNDGYFYLYRADYPDGAKAVPFPENEKTDYADSWDLPKWHPSIHMPKEAARIFLCVTDVRVERLQEIDADGVLAEGMTSGAAVCGDMEIAAKEFALLWNSTIKPEKLDIYGWEANPWVWVIEFERISREEARG